VILLGTGITGSGRARYLEGVRELASGEGREVDMVDVGPSMFDKARELGVDIPGDKILDLDEIALRFLRATVFEGIVHRADGYGGFGSEKDMFISLHMSFRWRKYIMPAFDYNYLNDVAPDIFVTVIDSIASIRRRIDSYPELRHWRERLTLKELLIWQDEEVFITSMVASILSKPFYMIPYSKPYGDRPYPRLLRDIIYDYELPRGLGERPRKRKAYLSYPMTHVKNVPDFVERKDEFVEKLEKNNIIVFDPMMVEDYALIDAAREAGDRERVWVDAFNVEIPVSEIMDAEEYIRDSTIARDYRFIDQSDMVIIFYPTSQLSPGVLSEMIYGFTHMKRVYTYFTEKDISPFLRNHSNYISDDPDSLISRIREDFGI